MSDPILTDDGGTSETRVGPVSIQCMSADAREALYEAVKVWERDHAGKDINEGYSPYGTLYWLFRYSGLIRYGDKEP